MNEEWFGKFVLVGAGTIIGFGTNLLMFFVKRNTNRNDDYSLTLEQGKVDFLNALLDRVTSLENRVNIVEKAEDECLERERELKKRLDKMEREKDKLQDRIEKLSNKVNGQ